MRKKSILLVLVLAAFLLPASVFAQSLAIDPDDTVLDPAPIFDGLVEFSLTSNVSMGLLRNELGAAATVDETGFGPSFSELESNYFFGGLGNLPLVPAVGGGIPFFIGYYNAGDTPWSAFLRSQLTDPAVNLSTDTATSTDVTVVDGDTHLWVDNETVTEYDNVLVGTADNRAQFLLSIGGINTGLYVRSNVNNAPYAAADNYVETDEFYYDTAVAGEEPSPALDYRIVEEASDMGGRQSTWQLAAPIFLRTGDMSHYARIGASLGITDRSTASSTTHSVPEDSTDVGFGAGVFTDVAAEETDKDIATDVGAKYTLTLPGMLVPGENNELAISTNLTGTFYGRTRAASTYTEDFTFAVSGEAQTVAGSRDETTTEFTYEGVMDFGADVMASHSIYFDLGGALFGLRPGLGVGFEREHLAADRTYASEAVGQATVDGAFDGSLTITQTRVSPPRRTDTLDVSLMLPATIDIEPGTLPFGVILGASPWLAWQRDAATTTAPLYTTQTVVRDADSVVTSDVTVNQPETGVTRTVDQTWTAGALHNIGLYLNVGERVRIDIALNGANLLDFESFTLQTIIALP